MDRTILLVLKINFLWLFNIAFSQWTRVQWKLWFSESNAPFNTIPRHWISTINKQHSLIKAGEGSGLQLQVLRLIAVAATPEPYLCVVRHYSLVGLQYSGTLSSACMRILFIIHLATDRWILFQRTLHLLQSPPLIGLWLCLELGPAAPFQASVR